MARRKPEVIMEQVEPYKEIKTASKSVVIKMPQYWVVLYDNQPVLIKKEYLYSGNTSRYKRTTFKEKHYAQVMADRLNEQFNTNLFSAKDLTDNVSTTPGKTRLIATELLKDQS